MRLPTLHASPPVHSRWRPKPTALRLRPEDVDVWSASLDDQPAEALRAMRALMSRDEAERAQAFYFERDRRRFIVGRGILRVLLGRYLDRAPGQLVFLYGPNGKPALSSDVGAAALHFNVAHSEGLALYAFTPGGEVGIDVEWIRELPDWEQVAETVFSWRELAHLRACPPERRREEFFRAWTRQEAVLKDLGTGLGGASSAQEEAAAFNVYPLHPAPGFAAALAAAPTGRWTTFHTWSSDNRSSPFQAHSSARRTRLEPITTNGAHIA
jgi:4'-phosphopantetheinyl transferase